MTTTTVHLLRHGEVHNPEKVLYGRLPGYQLSADGHAMAEAAATALAGRTITAVISSPLERARQTAAPLVSRFGVELRIDERLIESENSFEGKSVGVGVGGGAVFLRPQYWPLLVNPFRPSWGEPYAQVAERMLAAVATARDLARGAEAVCVSHQLPIWTTRRAAEGRRLWHRPDHRQCGLASLTSLTYEDDELAVVTYAEPAGPAARRPAVPGA